MHLINRGLNILWALIFVMIICTVLYADTHNNRIVQTKEENSDNNKTESSGEIKEDGKLTFDDIRGMRAGDILDMEDADDDLIDSLFFKEEIGDEVMSRIMGISYKENNNISLGELNYIRVLHVGFDDMVHIGELIVNKAIADDIIDIMKILYNNKYPIEKMLLVDEYGGDDITSMSDNNTSAFNYRLIANTDMLSNHAMGMAIDINPLYNPYVTADKEGNINISPENGSGYADRTKDFMYKIDEFDLCYKLFISYGFSWGGSWSRSKDYQHFEKTIN
ncbi:MAG: M15 family metallopeptidase [Lachnospiraceae bacterium]